MPDLLATLLRNPKGVKIQPLAGDASGRRYSRWSLPSFPAMVHMDAQNDRAGSCDDFVKIAQHLSELGLSSPQILARDGDTLLLEDLGDAIFARLLETDDSHELDLYLSAVDLLLRVQKNPQAQGLQKFGAEEMAVAITPAFEWYQKGGTGQTDERAMSCAVTLIQLALAESETLSPVMILRDYHAENLLWLPEREGVAKCGVLDFQDALLGHPTYDLASLLEDARRDVSEATRAAAIAHFLEQSDMDEEEFHASFAVQAAQRNLRILGVLARLSMVGGKTHYLDFLPRVWAHLMRDLEHPALTEFRALVIESLPEPTPAIIAKIREYHA